MQWAEHDRGECTPLAPTACVAASVALACHGRSSVPLNRRAARPCRRADRNCAASARHATYVLTQRASRNALLLPGTTTFYIAARRA
eukprot:6204291-Pleurochrysis_carterae.AAC.1